LKELADNSTRTRSVDVGNDIVALMYSVFAVEADVSDIVICRTDEDFNIRYPYSFIHDSLLNKLALSG